MLLAYAFYDYTSEPATKLYAFADDVNVLFTKSYNPAFESESLLQGT